MNDSIEVYRTKLKEMLPDLAERYGVAELGIFGSRLRGDNGPDSDLDVLVSFRAGAYVSLFTLARLENTISDHLGIKADLVVKKELIPKIGKRILAEAQYL